MAVLKSSLSLVSRQDVPAVENPQAVEIVPVPESYQAALSEGWYVTEEKTPWVHGKGLITMRNDLYAQAIRIEYKADSIGYQYGKPEAISE